MQDFEAVGVGLPQTRQVHASVPDLGHPAPQLGPQRARLFCLRQGLRVGASQILIVLHHGHRMTLHGDLDLAFGNLKICK
jgi:hypothetical protein